MLLVVVACVAADGVAGNGVAVGVVVAAVDDIADAISDAVTAVADAAAAADAAAVYDDDVAAAGADEAHQHQ